LCAGITYTITVTDGNGCTGTTTVQLTTPSSPVIALVSQTNASCNAVCDGLAQVTTLAGLNYSIAGPGTPTINATGAASNLCAGNYVITATDANGCTGTTSVTITEPTAVVVTVTASTDPSCTPGCDGTTSVGGSGGTGPITYGILPAGPTQPTAGNFSGLCAGTTYTITGTDGNGCTGTTTISLSTPNAPIINVTAQTAVTCFGDCDGTAQVTTIAGITYTISGPGTPSINATGAASNLCVGNYVITATDANSCVGTTSVTITGPALLTLAINTSTDPSCVPGCDGTATITTTGGNGSNVYTIAPSGTINASTGAASDLCAGTIYTITATDVNGCSSTTTIQLTTPTSPVINITSSTDPSCVPGCDGTATVTAIVGGNYTIAPSGTIDPITGAASALCAGITYTITVTDGNGCTGTTTVQLTTPGSPVINITSSTDPSCVPGCDGTATVTAIVGGNYTISPSGTIDPLTGAASALCAGITYTITVTDGNGCTGTTTIQLTTPSSPVIALVSQTNASCNAVCDGLAQVTTLAGLNYSIAGPGTPTINATGAASNLCAGNYVITATDANGCTGTTSVTITEPTAVVVTVTASTDPSCTPGCDGTASVGGSGGTGPITYGILPAGPTQPTAGNFSGLCAGTTYTITGTDGNGCTGTTTISLSTPNAPIINVTAQTAVTCFGDCDGTAQVTTIAGITYGISGPGAPLISSTGSATQLCVGNYVITATDANSCVGTTSVTITGPALLTLAINTSTDPSCVPGCDGTATITTTGGNGSNVYTIAPSGTINASTGAASDLCAGTIYTITATDVNGCSSTTTIQLTTPTSPVINITSSTDPSCVPGCDGTATVTAIVGGNYTIAPSGTIDPLTGAATALCAGITYTITVTDGNGCTGTTTVQLTTPGSPVINITSSTNPSCVPGCDGTATVTAIVGGTYSIAPSGTIDPVTGAASALCSGITYTITVTDANSCTGTTSILLTTPGSPVIAITSSTDPSCVPGCDGTATVTAIAGGTYSIAPSGTIDPLTGAATALCAGITYTITVTDGNGCTGTTTVQLTTPGSPVINITSSTDPSCVPGCDGTATVTAIAGGTYSIAPSGTIDPVTGAASALCAGITYTITVTDANSCTGTTSILLTTPGSPVIAITSSTDPSCVPGCDGTATVTAIAGGTYSIAPSGTIDPLTGAASALCAGISYTITVTDGNGCTGTTTILLNAPNSPTVAISSIVNPTTSASCDGTAQATGAGGSIPYSYSISAPGVIDPLTGAISALCDGCYTVTVSDGNGCTGTATFCVAATGLPLSVTAIGVDATCFGTCDGTAQANPSGGAAGYTYLISGSGSPAINATGAATGLCAGAIYTITVSDANLATATTTIVISEPTQLTVSITSSNDPSCVPGCDGTATVTSTGGSGSNTFTIAPSGTIDPLTGAASALCAGITYTITVTDVNGCVSTTSILLNTPGSPVINITSSTDPSCVPGCDGTATVTAIVGGNYTIAPSGTIDPLTGAATALCAGITYTITVTDGNGCTGTTTVQLTTPGSPIINITSSTNPSCLPGCDGTATVTAIVGGTYSIAPSGTIDPVTGAASALCSGITYTITVTDANSCTGTTSILLTTPGSPVIAITSSTDPSCVPGCDGTATVTAIAGGTYSIAPSGTIDPVTGAASALCAGIIYTITVTDANSCTGTTSILLTTPGSPVIAITSSTDPSCVPGCDGTATVTAIAGGTYSIAPSGTIDPVTGAASALCSGITYTITVTDANSCTGTTSILLTTPGSPVIAITSSTDPSCVPGCDGTATVTALAGVTYSIAPSGTIDPITGVASALCSGITYTITVTDGNGCTGTTSILLNAPNSPVINITSSTNPSCVPGCDGTATVTAIAGGTYSIAPSGTIDPVTGAASALCAGITYTITVTDGNGCAGTTSILLNAPSSPVINITSSTNPSCVPGCDGTATVTAIAGGAYSIAPSGTIDPVTGAASALCAGITYTITVTDGNGCTGTTLVQLNTPSSPIINITSSTNPSCVPGCDGTATVTAIAGGTYTIAPSGTINPATGAASALCGGTTYTITVTDANGCTGSTTIQLITPVSPVINVTSTTDPSCLPGCDGTATVTSILGGNYTIAPGGAINPATGAASALCAGTTYTITVTDGNGCTGTTTLLLNTPASPSIVITSQTNLTCNGVCNGTADVTLIAGGVYTIAPAATINAATGAATNLCAGTYTITVTQANGCTGTTSVTITEPTAVQITNLTASPTLCFGQANGSLSISVSGGTPLYTATTNPASSGAGPANSPLAITGLAPSTYTVTITDANGCTATSTATVQDAAQLVFTSATVVNPTCANACNGTVSVTANGGTGTITYTINPQGPQSNTTGNFNALCAGTFTVTATDVNGCTVTTTVTLTDPAALVVASSSFTDPLCFGNANGTITVTLGGGTVGAGYVYAINPAATQPTPGNFTGLTAQAYTITGSDANGCTISTVITLTDPGQLTWNNPTFTNISCFGGNNGTINAPLNGGTGVITYSLTPGALTNTSGFFGALTAQCYTVTGTDVNGCSLTTVICLSEPPVLTLGVPATVNILCNGASTGSISITANGGTPNYTFSLNPAQGTQVTPGNFTNLPAGTYAITVTDNNGCTSVTTGIQLSEPPAITFNTVNVQDVACYGDATGTITVVAQGGVGGFTYSLNPSGAQPTPGFFNNLYAGLYTAIATDANGCTLATSIEVKQNPELLITSLTLTEPICFGESNGAISAVATGGVAPIQYSLNNSPFQNNGNFVNIPAGSYIITLRDVLGCMKDSLIELTQPSEVGATLDLTGANCVDSKDGRAIVTAFGGRGGYKYYVTPGLYINKSGVFTGLENGTYTLRVADTAGCEYSTTFVINPPANALSNYMTKLDLACHGKGNEGTATANVSGGTPPYNYLWNTSPAQTTPTASTLYFGLYKVEITDANGCRIKDSVYIEEGPCCDIAFIPSAFSPNGDNNNDEFRVLTTAGVELIQLEVRNRWGQRVWSTSDYRKGWDGLFEGKAADVDTYQYLLRYRCTRDGEIYLKKGDVLLVR
jgi:gliding motility-associated-like protein